MRPPTGKGFGQTGRMTTGQPMSTMRSRQGTAVQPVLGVGALTDVKVMDRPMTMQGVSGMRTGKAGPTRQIHDKTYFINELRKRCTELQEEITKLNKEINDIQQDCKLYASLDKRYETLVKTVRTLEGDLADHNLASDKVRTDTRPEEVHHMFLMMKQQNTEQSKDIDRIFLENKSHEEEIQRMEHEIASMARAAEERLCELHPDQRVEYEELRDERSLLARALFEARDELEEVSGRLGVVEGRLGNDPLRSRLEQLVNVREEMLPRLEALREEAKQCNMSIPEQREILLARVKSDNAEIVTTEKLNTEIKLDNEKLKALIREVSADAQEQKDDGESKHKHEILFAKDQEMTQFIDGFAESKSEEERKMKEKQERVVQLLENISKTASLPTDLATHLRDMEGELDFKTKELQNAETTQSRLEAELLKRESELEKIDSLDLKISGELQQVEEQSRRYEHEIVSRFDMIDGVKEKGAQQLRELEARKACLEGRVSTLSQQVGFLKLKQQGRRQQLADDEAVCAIETQERKIQQFGQTLFSLKSFIQQKTHESDFHVEMSSCLEAAEQINLLLHQQPPRLAPCA